MSFFNDEELAAMNQQLLQALGEAQGKLSVPHAPASSLAMQPNPVPIPGVVLQLVLGLLQKTMVQNASLLLIENTLDAVVSGLPQEQQDAIKVHLQEVTDQNIEQIKENAKKAKEAANQKKIAMPKGPLPTDLRGKNGRF